MWYNTGKLSWISRKYVQNQPMLHQIMSNLEIKQTFKKNLLKFINIFHLKGFAKLNPLDNETLHIGY